MLLPIHVTPSDQDFAAAGRLNLTIPAAVEYSYICEFLAEREPLVFVVFPRGYSTLNVKTITTRLLKTLDHQSLLFEARSGEEFFPAHIVPATTRRGFDVVKNALRIQGYHAIVCFNPKKENYPDSIDKLVDFWQKSVGVAFGIVESTYCNGNIWSQVHWDSIGLLRDLCITSRRKIQERRASGLTREFADVRLNVVEFSGPRNIYSKAGKFQHEQKVAVEYVFLQPSDTYRSSTHEFGTADLDAIGAELVANHGFKFAVHRTLTLGNK
jgi:hypothetical protein